MAPKIPKRLNKLFLTASLFFIFFSSTAHSQRCGDGILFSITNNADNLIDSSRLKITGFYYDSYYADGDAEVKPGMKLKYPEFYQVKKDTIYISKLDHHVDWKDKNHFYIRTVCGMLLMRVTVTYKNKIMQLDIYNIPGDNPFKASDFPFTEGKFEINLNGYADDLGFEKDSDGAYIMKFDKFKAIE